MSNNEDLFNYKREPKEKKVKVDQATILNEFEKISQERKDSIASGDTPPFFITQGYLLFKRKYAFQGETVREAYTRIAKTLAQYYPENTALAEQKFFDLMWKGFLAPSTPVMNNTGLNRGDSVSCSGGYIGDSIHDFYTSLREAAVLSQRGYGTSGYLGDIRPRGSHVSTGGKASGVVPVFDDFVTMSNKVSQGNNRRGQWAGYLPLMHGDFDELYDYVLKNPSVANVGWNFTDKDIENLNNKEPETLRRFNQVMYLRSRHGKGYIFKVDTANRLAPQAIKNSGIPIKGSNLCVTGDTYIHTNHGIERVKDLYESKSSFKVAVDKRTEYQPCLSTKEENFYNTTNLERQVRDEIYYTRDVKIRYTNGMHKTSEKAKVYELTLSSGRVIRCTEDHYFYACRKSHRFSVNHNGIFKVKLKDLRPGDDKVLIQPNKGGFGHKGDFCTGYMLGLLFNNTNKTDPMIASFKEPSNGRMYKLLIETIIPYFNNNYNVNLKVYKNTLGIQLIIGKDGKKFFNKLWNLDEVGNGISSEVLQGSEECVRGFLQGLADRSLRVIIVNTVLAREVPLKKVNFSLNNVESARMLQMLLANAGIYSTIAKLKTRVYVTIHAGSMVNYFKFINILDEDGTHLLTNRDYTNKRINIDYYTKCIGGKRNESHFVDTVKSIEYVGEEPVYDTTQEYSHSLIFNGMVTGNCNEIMLPQDSEYSFSCVLSSLNLSKWYQFEEDTIFWSVVFLDCVVSHTLVTTEGNKDIEPLYNFTRDFRALGLGTLGFHTLIQELGLPFDSLKVKMLNNQIFSKIQKEAIKASKHLAKLYGEPKWCEGTGMRNATLMAIAPNTSSAILAGGTSQGIEPIAANSFNQNIASGEITRINPTLIKYLKEYNLYSDDLIRTIQVEHQGSIQFIDELPENVKRIFLTAYEIDQRKIIQLASDRQRFIDQGQSLNLFFSGNSSEHEIASITKSALNDEYIKGLYYQRSIRSVRASSGECVACEG